MKTRLILTIALLVTVPFVCSSSAYADLVTDNYVEEGANNRERMRWDFRCTPLLRCVGSPAGQQAWASQVQVLSNGLQNFLQFTSQHVTGPHTNIDVNPAAGVFFNIPFANLQALPIQNVPTPLFTFSVVHQTTFENHADVYRIFATRIGQDEFAFIFASTHVPEPASMLLLGTGLAAVAMKLRKRRGLKKE